MERLQVHLGKLDAAEVRATKKQDTDASIAGGEQQSFNGSHLMRRNIEKEVDKEVEADKAAGAIVMFIFKISAVFLINQAEQCVCQKRDFGPLHSHGFAAEPSLGRARVPRTDFPCAFRSRRWKSNGGCR